MEKKCIRCLLRDLSEADMQNIEKYKDAIKSCDRADNDLYERRLGICKECEKLNEGTCLACGCYVELRAFMVKSACPHKKW